MESGEDVNHTTAACGHSTIAVGSPGSPVRTRLEASACEACVRNAIEHDDGFVYHPRFGKGLIASIDTCSYSIPMVTVDFDSGTICRAAAEFNKQESSHE